MAETRPPMLLAPIYAGRRLSLVAGEEASLDRVPTYLAQGDAYPLAWNAWGIRYLSGRLCDRWGRHWHARGATMAEAVQAVIVQMREDGFSPYLVPVESPWHTAEDAEASFERCIQLQNITPPRQEDTHG